MSPRTLSLSKFVSFFTKSLSLSRKIKPLWTPVLKKKKLGLLCITLITAWFMANMQPFLYSLKVLASLLKSACGHWPSATACHNAKIEGYVSIRTSWQNEMSDVKIDKNYADSVFSLYFRIAVHSVQILLMTIDLRRNRVMSFNSSGLVKIAWWTKQLKSRIIWERLFI